MVVRAINKHYDKPLAHAIWSAQRETYQSSVRKPYIVTGVYTSRLRPTTVDAPEYIARRILGMMEVLIQRREGPLSDYARKELKETIEYFKGEFERLLTAYPHHKLQLDRLMRALLARVKRS